MGKFGVKLTLFTNDTYFTKPKDTKDLKRFHVLAHKLYDWFEHHGKRLTAEEVMEHSRTMVAYARCLLPALRILDTRNQRHPLSRLEDRFLAA
jgi:hypothetical protein